MHGGGTGVKITEGEDDFGLDVYEPAFFQRREDWLADKYSVKVTLGVEINQCVGTPSSRRRCDLKSYATGAKAP